ncbi:hypothetical protein Tco_1327935 [Tanacetum coccineum]
MIRAKLEVNTARLKKLVLLAEVSTASRVKARVIMSSATSAVTYTSSFTRTSESAEPSWGARCEEAPRIHWTPPVPQDEDEREPMFVQAHDPDYVSEPIYPEYIPLEDEHEFSVEEQPILLVDSPTAESPVYVTESDPEEDPKEYEDDETEDGPVDYPMDGGDIGDDDDGDSSGDDADEDEDDEDEDDEDEEEEEGHIAPADSTMAAPIDEPVFPPEGTEPVIPPPSTDVTNGARITVRASDFHILPQKQRVNTRVTELVELHEHDTQDLYALLVDAQDSRSRISQRVDMDSQRSFQTHRDHVYAHETHLQAHQTQLQLQSTLIQTHHQRLSESLVDMRREMSDMQAELLALREQQRRARQPGPEARIPDHQDASGDADSHI